MNKLFVKKNVLYLSSFAKVIYLLKVEKFSENTKERNQFDDFFFWKILSMKLSMSEIKPTISILQKE
jgi:hypothetical protein